MSSLGDPNNESQKGCTLKTHTPTHMSDASNSECQLNMHQTGKPKGLNGRLWTTEMRSFAAIRATRETLRTQLKASSPRARTAFPVACVTARTRKPQKLSTYPTGEHGLSPASISSLLPHTGNMCGTGPPLQHHPITKKQTLRWP